MSNFFIEESKFESHLFGGFITTTNYFIKEIFSNGLDRAVFGEYTLLLKFNSPFLVIYIYKGDSYYAIQKLANFVDDIKKHEPIWQNLMKNYQANKSVNFQDIPLLKTVITNIFVEKNLEVKEL